MSKEREIRMYDVGNGLHMKLLFGPVFDPVTIDFGGDKVNSFSKALHNIFILSHFHEDHYNLLINHVQSGDTELKLETIFYPCMPEFQDNTKFFLRLLTMSIFRTPGPLQHIILDFMERNNSLPIDFIPLARGNQLKTKSQTFDVLWPPAVIRDQDTLKDIRSAMRDFDAAVKEFPGLGEIYRRLAEQEVMLPRGSVIQDNQFDSTDYSENDTVQSKDHQDELQESDDDMQTRNFDETLIDTANKSLKKAANHLSLAFMLPGKFLFLGDLEKKQLKIIGKELHARGLTHFDTIISAHHGTHWHSALEGISSKNCLASVGNTLFPHVKYEYAEDATQFHTTFTDGKIVLPFS